MRKGIPYSIGVHVFFLTVAVLYGNWVPTPAVSEPRPIRVHIVEMPQPTPPAAPVVKEQPLERPPEPRPAPPPEPKPAKVPQKKPKQEAKKPAPPKPDPEPRRESSEAKQESAPQPISMAAVMGAGPQVAGTDEPFPHDWYLELVRQRVLRGWNPAQVTGGQHATAVHFFIERSGQVARPAIVRASGIGLLDREALRAVQAVGQLPPLPREFGSRQLGVTFEFTVKSGP